jgi:D-alanyl-D-alanine carboxypeptidase
MRRFFALFLILSALAPDALARRRAAAPPPFFNVPAADVAASKALERGVPGLSISIRKGDASFHRAYGSFDREANVPASVHHEWQVGSVTKQFTAAAVMRLVESGVLRVEDRARQWLPELDAPFDAITIEQLLTHTSGLGEYSNKLEDPWVPKTQQEILAIIESQPLQFTPGAQFAYRNAGYFLLGMILERASSKAYAQLLRDLFFEPLGLNRTSYCGTVTPSPNGYLLTPDGAFPVPAADMSMPFSAGAICSTTDDLLRWTHALANGTAVSPQSYVRMTTSVDPASAPPPQYGYGLITFPLDGRRRIWHNGDILGFQSHVAYFPEERLTIVVLVNANDVSRDQATVVANDVARAMR